MNFIDLFSGIGGFRSALELNGHKCIAYSEVDKFAKQSYQAIYSTEDEIDLGDITQISEEYLSHFKKENDIVVGGSPCQSFSMAGSRKGFEDTRGTLFFEYAKVVKETQPKYFLFENVKGMLSHNKGNTIRVVLETFNQLGYYIDFNVFNSKYYDVPQNRERIYIVGKRKDLVDNPNYQEKVKGKKKFDEIHNWAVDNVSYVKLLPELKTEVTTRLIDVLEDEVDEKYYLSEEKTKKLTLNSDLSGKLNMYDYNERYKVYSVNKVSPTLNTMQGGDRQPKIAVKGFKEMVNVRKYEVDIEKLKLTLRNNKILSNKQIANELNVAITKVEHWFRKDKSFAIPDKEVWYQLKELLNIETDEFDLPITTFVEKESDFDTTNRIYDVDYLSSTLNTTSEPKVAVVGNTSKTGHKSHDVHDTDGISPTIAARDYKGAKQIALSILTPNRINKQQNGRRFKEDGEPMFTLTSQDKHGIVVREDTKQGYSIAEEEKGFKTAILPVTNGLRIRKLTPLECWRLQGFTDEQFYKAQDSGLSNSQLYKQAGNSVTVNVVDYIVENL